MSTYTLRNEQGQTVILSGRLLGHITTDDGSKPRWTELSVYERDAGGYAYHRLGRSSVFHRPDASTCRQGRIIALNKLTTDPEYQDAMQCTRCNPMFPEDYGDEAPAALNATIRVEGDIANLSVHDTAEEVVAAMYTVSGNPPERRLSGPARDLLAALLASSPEFAAIQQRSVRL